LVLGAACAVALTSYAVWQYRQPKTLDEAAVQALSCFIAADSSCLYGLENRQETDTLGLSKAQFKTVLDDYVFPAFEGWSADGEPDHEHSEEQGIYKIRQSFLSQDDDPFDVTLVVDATDDGPRLFILNQLIFAAALVQSEDIGTYQFLVGEEGKDMLRRAIERDKATLEGLGLKGISAARPGSKLETWDEFIRDHLTADPDHADHEDGESGG
jgi:hypothetical protein